jgi:chaperonin GroES
VISVGNGKLLDDGSRGKVQVKVGERVIFSSYAGETFKVDEEEYLLMREDDILAVIEG